MEFRPEIYVELLAGPLWNNLAPPRRKNQSPSKVTDNGQEEALGLRRGFHDSENAADTHAGPRSRRKKNSEDGATPWRRGERGMLPRVGRS